MYRYYTNEAGVAGHNQRNKALSVITDGYFYSLDDDNIIHPDFFREIEPYVLQNKIIVVSQVDKNNNRRLKADKENVRVGGIDTAQYLVPRDKVNGIRFKLVYEGDGLFITDIYKAYDKDFVFIDKDLCYYNYLR